MSQISTVNGHQRPRSIWPSDKNILPKGKKHSAIEDKTSPSIASTAASPTHSPTHLTDAACEALPPVPAVPRSRPTAWLPKSRGEQGLLKSSSSNPSLVSITDRQDPWEVYEARVRIFQGGIITLARVRQSKADLVAIQQLDGDNDLAQTRAQQALFNGDRYFPRLQQLFLYQGQSYLIWEACEVSVREILASECRVTESEIAEIVWPVLKGVALLRTRGRALSTLTPECILLTRTGSVKIAGAEQCREVPISEQDPSVLQLSSLASIVDDLLAKNGPEFKWSTRIQSMPQKLRTIAMEEIIRDSFFHCMSGTGDLALLVKVVDMSAYRHIEFLHGLLTPV